MRSKNSAVIELLLALVSVMQLIRGVHVVLSALRGESQHIKLEGNTDMYVHGAAESAVVNTGSKAFDQRFFLAPFFFMLSHCHSRRSSISVASSILHFQNYLSCSCNETCSDPPFPQLPPLLLWHFFKVAAQHIWERIQSTSTRADPLAVKGTNLYPPASLHAMR
jgi:hypothetical protein